jgi:pyruvate/2-oxoglutarate dehydrogenase complex dihydrolipoamide dehydrogenase (E3) component
MADVRTQLSYPGRRHDDAWRRLVCPADYRNPTPKQRYHLIVIGAGPAGLVTSIIASGLGAKVALIEKKAMGGDCLNVGCVPSKSLLEYTARAASTDCFDEAFGALREVRASVAHHDSVGRYRDAGVDVFFGGAKFRDESTVMVDGLVLSGRRVVIATGARPSVPPIPGLADSRALTNETLFDLTSRPNRLAVLGGGALGCEMAQAFARMGCEVHLFEIADRILPSEHPGAGGAVAAALRRAGVTVHVDAEVSNVLRRGPSIVVSTDTATITTDELLIATGRRANTDELNLAAVGVEASADALIEVDKYLRTSNPKIYAAGDVCSKLAYTHNADAHARIAAQNALFFPFAAVDEAIVPHCTYTSPEVARVGPTPDDLRRQGTPFDVYRVSFSELDRGRTQGDVEGFAEILTKHRNSAIVGATIVGRDAGEQIAAVCVAMANELGIDAFSKAVLPYPTRAEYLHRIADAYQRKRLTPLARALIGSWLKLRA